MFFSFFVFFFKQKTAYELRISDWSSDVCSSDLQVALYFGLQGNAGFAPGIGGAVQAGDHQQRAPGADHLNAKSLIIAYRCFSGSERDIAERKQCGNGKGFERVEHAVGRVRSEEHTSELQSLMRTPYAVFCL